MLINKIKAHFDIVDVIGWYDKNVKTGTFRMPCPIHGGTNLSMSVNQDKQRFHCFKCGAGGSVIDFYMAYHDLTLSAALNQLAKIAGISGEKVVNYVPAAVKKQIADDRFLVKMAEIQEKEGYRHTYKDKQEIRLAKCRIEGLVEKYNIKV